MSEKVLYDQNGNVMRVLHTNENDDPWGDFTIETIEDVEPVIESAAILADEHSDKGDLKHVARVPVHIVEKAMREGWYNDQAAWRKWCNDPDNRDFRVWKGRV